MSLQSSNDSEHQREVQRSLVFSADENYLHGLSTSLVAYGLTYNQAKIYLYLLGRGPVPAREISKSLGMHRVDVYRKLKELEDLGVIELYLDSPKKFAAMEPKMAISALMNRTIQKVSNLKRISSDLVQNLELHQTSHVISRQSSEGRNALDSYYKIGMGRERYFAELRDLVRKTKNEIVAITSRNGVIRAYVNGFYDEYKMATSRGVVMKMIAEVDDENLRYARKFARILRLRHVNDVHFRFIASDKSIVILSARFDDNNVTAKSDTDNYFVFRDPVFATAICFLFEHLWDDAVEFSDALVGAKISSPKV